jgi:D-methionine transport system ATP-binding protein
MIQLDHLNKTFTTKDGDVDALKDICLTVNDGDIYGIIGMSGAGKSTLVRCINMLESPTSGAVLVDGVDMTKLSPAELREKRRNITMIFQSFNLLMQRTCLKNICFPLELAGRPKAEAEKKAKELLELVGLPDKANVYPAQLSGGQQQRIAIARALATNPKVLLCDEATSALDPKTTHAILELIRDIHDKMGLTVIIITHQMNVVEEICNRVAILDHGSVVEEGNVTDVFSQPKSDAAKRLVYPDGFQDAEFPKTMHKIRVVYNGAYATSKPLIAQMAEEEGILASILFASTRSIGKKAYGTMILGIDDSKETVDRAIAYIRKTKDIEVEEVE